MPQSQINHGTRKHFRTKITWKKHEQAEEKTLGSLVVNFSIMSSSMGISLKVKLVYILVIFSRDFEFTQKYVQISKITTSRKEWAKIGALLHTKIHY